MDKGTIYKIENLVNGKVYIGQTKAGFKKRINEHLYSLRKNTHNNDYLQKSWNKYGEDNFDCSIVEACTIDRLDDLEVKWITFYKQLGISYNLEGGGNKNKEVSSYTRMKMSKNSKEKWNNPVYANRMRSLFAKVHGGKNNVNAQKVICINTGEVFETITEAAKKYNLSIIDISKVCSGERISCGFFKNGEALQFAHFEHGKTYKLKKLRNLKAKRRIVLTNTKEVFESTHAAARKYGFSQGSIIKCCKGQIRCSGKLPNNEYAVWVYEEEYNPNKDYSFVRFEHFKGKNNAKAKRVICLTTGEVFDTMVEAGKKYNIGGNGCKISLACNGKRKHVGSLADGTKLKWAYYTD